MLLCFFHGSIFAATSSVSTSFELVSDKTAYINIEDKGSLEKKMIEFNSKERSVTIQLTLKNTANEEIQELPAEIALAIDNSDSMVVNKVGDKTRKELVFESAKTLVNKLFEKNPNIKISVVSFSSLNAQKGETEGTINDAKLQQNLTNNKNSVISAIDAISPIGPRTNIDAGLQVAKSSFSSENNRKYIILLTDGIPNNTTTGIYGRFSGDTATQTKNTVNSLKNTNINLITMMTGLRYNSVETTSKKTYQQLVEEIFGTVEAPTYGDLHLISDNQIEQVVTNNIYNDLLVKVDNTIKNIKVVDTFPQEIVDNFNFSHVASPNIGEVTAQIDKTNNTITWDVEVLKPGEVATLSYKLTLKDDYSKDIVDVVLPTNEDVSVDYTIGDKDNTLHTPDSPEVIVKEKVITEPEPEPTPEPEPDPVIPKKPDVTVAPDPIPQTGVNNILLISGIIALSGIAIATGTYLHNLYKK